MRYTFKEYLAYIEITLGCRLLDWQKEILRNFYNGKDWYYMPSRCSGRKIAYKALELLEKIMFEENKI